MKGIMLDDVLDQVAVAADITRDGIVLSTITALGLVVQDGEIIRPLYEGPRKRRAGRAGWRRGR